MNYDEFIEQKSRKAMAYGFEPYEITAPLFDWQKHVASWAVRKGRAALFEECGLGKTLQALLGGHGVWTPEIEREIIAWADMRPREIICRKCGLRKQLGKPPQSDF